MKKNIDKKLLLEIDAEFNGRMAANEYNKKYQKTAKYHEYINRFKQDKQLLLVEKLTKKDINYLNDILPADFGRMVVVDHDNVIEYFDKLKEFINNDYNYLLEWKEREYQLAKDACLMDLNDEFQALNEYQEIDPMGAYESRIESGEKKGDWKTYINENALSAINQYLKRNRIIFKKFQAIAKSIK